jgi:hypothetical protein
MEGRIVLNELYETVYGISDHLRANVNPLEVILYQEAEHVDTCFAKKPIDDFIDLDIHKHTGLSIKEFLNLPFYDSRYIIKRIKRRLDKESSVAKEAAKGLKLNK